jgi:valyl-tRNA synthetase
LSRLAGISPPRTLAAGETAPISAVALLGTLEILVPMAGLIDPQAELDRLAKRLKKAEADLNKLEAKHANADFARTRRPRSWPRTSCGWPNCARKSDN